MKDCASLNSETSPPADMSNLMDCPREIKDMIYTEALITDNVLIAKNEQIEYADFAFSQPRPLMALLRVSRRVNTETTDIFYAVNIFKLSAYPTLGKPSIFTSHATLFRSVIVEFSHKQSEHYFPGGDSSPTNYDLIYTWKKQIETLVPMANLKYLELDVSAIAERVSGRRRFQLQIVEGLCNPPSKARAACESVPRRPKEERITTARRLDHWEHQACGH